jgi:phospho-N-acetylmuramoyl-pentapeptide-transferase
LTDGLDGLAGGVSATYLGFISVIIFLQITLFKNLYLLSNEYYNLIMLSACLVGAVLGFLALNVNRAKVFMGDTGSLSLGGFIGAISVFSSNSFFIPVLGITFVISSISVIIQVLHFKRTGKRIFLMAPLHHHFQHKNCTETQISYWYFLTTLIMGALSILPYL